MSGAMELSAASRCRVCLQHQESILQLKNVVVVQGEKVSLNHILVSCCAVEILDDDKKPQTVCTQCVQDAEIAYKFKQTVEKSDLTLQNEIDTIMNVNIKEEEIDIDDGDNTTIEGINKTDSMAPIKDELTDCVSISDFNQLKFEQSTSRIKKIICKSLEHHLEDSYSRVCGQTFSSSEILDEHTLTQESPSTYTKVILKQSDKSRHHKCRFCQMSYKFPAELRYHTMTHTTVKHYLCSYCKNNFSLSLRSKCKRTHSLHSRKHVNKKTDKKASDSLNTEPRFDCSLYKKSSRRQTSLMSHNCINAGKKSRNSPPSESFVQQACLPNHERTRTEKKLLSCSYCSKSVTSQYDLTIHIRTHTGEKPYECLDCSKRFNSLCNFSRHRRIHTGEKPYQCLHCSKSFTTKSILNDHIRIHTGERPYECPHCSKRFTQISNLKKHELTHTGEKPYMCSYCNKRFNQRSNLNMHTLIHTVKLVK